MIETGLGRQRQRPLALPRGRWIVLLLGFMLSGAVTALPQNSRKSSPPLYKVQTEVVNVYAVVRDRHGRLISNLNRSDFEIKENGATQTIRYFSRAKNAPLTLCLMIDTSPSQGRVLFTEQQEAREFLNEVMRPEDLACVLHFDVEVELDQDFTASLPRLFQAINEQEINGGGPRPIPGTFPGLGGATHLYDAVWLASNDLMKDQAGRRVLILLTDGQDQGSKETLTAALDAALRAKVIIYSVDILDRGFYSVNMPTYNGGSVLKKLSQETGGRVIRVSRDKAADAFREITEELRSQYLLGYSPTDQAHDGSYRRIQVRVKERSYRVQARRGYYAPSR